MMVLQTLYAFIGTLSFAVIFNVKRKELIFCGITGGFGWFMYLFVLNGFGDSTLSAFFGSFAVNFVARILAISRKNPATIYSISGIIPFVPGAGMYYTMYGFISDDLLGALTKGIETLKIAGAIAVAIIFVFSLPVSLFKNWIWVERFLKGVLTKK